MKEKSLEDKLFILGIWFVLGSILVYILFQRFILVNSSLDIFFLFDECFWLQFFGIYCPGCGGTRAIITLSQGQFLQSLWYHPFVIYSIGLFSVFMISHLVARIPKNNIIKGLRFHDWYLYVGIIIIVFNFIIKNILKFYFNIEML